MVYNLSQEDIDDFDILKVEFKEFGKEKEAMDKLYTCPHCFNKYLLCECEKGIKDLINKTEDLKLLLESYKFALNCKQSKQRDDALKELSLLIKQYG